MTLSACAAAAIRSYRHVMRLAWLLSLLWGAASGSAWAHASLIASNPADASIVRTAPAKMSLTFNEPVSPITMKLVEPDGSVLLLSRYDLDGPAVAITAPSDMPEGSYGLSWRVISADGHPVGGTVVFSVGAPSAGRLSLADGDTPRSSRLVILFDRVALYAGLFFGVGGAFALAFLGPAGRIACAGVRAILASGLLAAAPAIGLQGLDVLAVSPGTLLQAAPWRAGCETSYAGTVLLAAAALLLAFGSTLRFSQLGRVVSLTALLLLGASFSASGHASDADPHWLTQPAVFLHAVTVAFWIGALAPLLLVLRSDGAAAHRFLARFSAAIPVAVAILVASGATLAVIQVREPVMLVSTGYGRLLLIKLALLALLFPLALVNRFKLTEPALRETAPLGGEGLPARDRLRRSIIAELILVALIFVTVANWRFTPPPRALIAAAEQPVVVHMHGERVMAEVTFMPAHVGITDITIAPMPEGFDELSVKELTVALSNPAAGIEPIRRKATLSGDGTWKVRAVALPAAGRWALTVDMLVSEFEMASVEGVVDIGP